MQPQDRINNPDRRQADVAPIVERRSGDERREPFVPEWRRRAIEQRDRLGYVAVADLTRTAA